MGLEGTLLVVDHTVHGQGLNVRRLGPSHQLLAETIWARGQQVRGGRYGGARGSHSCYCFQIREKREKPRSWWLRRSRSTEGKAWM
jgi:hypothetical protein